MPKDPYVEGFSRMFYGLGFILKMVILGAALVFVVWPLVRWLYERLAERYRWLPQPRKTRLKVLEAETVAAAGGARSSRADRPAGPPETPPLFRRARQAPEFPHKQRLEEERNKKR